jgi:plastocyanin
MNNKTIIGILIAVVLVGVVGIAIVSMSSTSTPQTQTTANTSQPVVDTPVSTTVTSTTTTTTENQAATSTDKKPAVTKTVVKPVQKTTSQANAVVISNYTFGPQTLTVKKGTTITWVNKDLARHTVTADNGSFESPFFGQGEIYSRTFNEVGTFAYHCSPHPYMKATIVVTE